MQNCQNCTETCFYGVLNPGFIYDLSKRHVNMAKTMQEAGLAELACIVAELSLASERANFKVEYLNLEQLLAVAIAV